MKQYCTFTVSTILYKSIFALAVVRSMCILALRVGNSITWVGLCSTLVDIWHKRMQNDGKVKCKSNKHCASGMQPCYQLGIFP